MDGVIVLKCGGSTIDLLSDRFFTNIMTLQKRGLKPIIVHGGGPAIKEMLQELQIESEFINGLRKTTQPVMDVVEMVLTGTVNNAITRKLNQSGLKAVGLSGSDAQLLTAKPKDLETLGFVGDIVDVNTSFLEELMNAGVIPVIAPIALDADGTRFNVNADTAAGAIAQATQADQFVLVTDVPGIMQEDQLIESITDEEIHDLIESGTIYGGMIPKVEAALSSLTHHLQEVMIVDGNQSVLSVSDTKLVGTVIKKSVGVS